MIDTCDDEVTVTYDYYHTHFDSFSDIEEHEGFKDAIEFLRDSISEEISVALLMHGDTWRFYNRKITRRSGFYAFRPAFRQVVYPFLEWPV